MLQNDFNKSYKMVQNLESAVLKDAKAQAKRIVEDARAREKQVLSTAKYEAEKSAAQYELEQKALITDSFSHQLTDAAATTRIELIKKRTEIQSAVFEKLFLRLCDFAKSDNYSQFINKRVCALDKSQFSDSITVFTSANNADSECAKSHFKNADIVISEDIKIGGLIIKDNKRAVIYDLTLDYSFENEKAQFLAISKLSVTGE